ncbi:MAG: CBS domain-containing protein [Elusimicrobia bacterium]|nr:CBS domain-containing protein [Elusimicrobiota bacterium]
MRKRVADLSNAVSEALKRLAQWGVETQDRIVPLLAPSETKFLAVTAVLIGAAAGSVTYIFDRLIKVIFRFGFGAREGLEPLEPAARWMTAEDIDRLPVVDRQDPRRVVGIISKTDLLALYAKRGS